MPNWIMYVIIALILIVIGVLVLRAMVPRLSPMPSNLGVTEGKLAPCPNTPNCVSTQATGSAFIEPIPFTSSLPEAQQKIVSILQGLPNAEIITNEPTYIHAITKSPTMGYIDDVEFYVDEATSQIEFRSAARLGRDDLSANRKRMEAIRLSFEE